MYKLLIGFTTLFLKYRYKYRYLPQIFIKVMHLVACRTPLSGNKISCLSIRSFTLDLI